MFAQKKSIHAQLLQIQLIAALVDDNVFFFFLDNRSVWEAGSINECNQEKQGELTSHNGFVCWNSLGVFSAFNLGMFELLRECVQQEWLLKWMYVQVIACFLSLLYSYAGVSTSKKQIPDGIKGRIIHHSFPVTLFVVICYPFVLVPSIPLSLFSLCKDSV